MLQVGKKLVTHNSDTNISTKETSYFCQQCDKTFSEKTPYFEHLKEHAGEWERTNSNSTYNSINSYKYFSVIFVVGNQEICLKCGKFLDTADELESHMKEHKYKCKYCHEVFEKKLA